jgi:hypothetical protein
LDENKQGVCGNFQRASRAEFWRVEPLSITMGVILRTVGSRPAATIMLGPAKWPACASQGLLRPLSPSPIRAPPPAAPIKPIPRARSSGCVVSATKASAAMGDDRRGNARLPLAATYPNWSKQVVAMAKHLPLGSGRAAVSWMAPTRRRRPPAPPGRRPRQPWD